MIVILRESTRKGKKWMVTVNGAPPVHFGADGYEDFTQHGDIKRKRSYIARHYKNEDWSARGINTAGFWSRWLLWNKPTIAQSINHIEKRFGVSIL
ncbi:MAG: DUF5754 family protein [Planctomycetota bacterium]